MAQWGYGVFCELICGGWLRTGTNKTRRDPLLPSDPVDPVLFRAPEPVARLRDEANVGSAPQKRKFRLRRTGT